MKSLIVSLGCLLIAVAAHAGLSPVRFTNESFESARHRAHFNKNFELHASQTDFLGRTSYPDRAKKPLKDLNLSEIPDVGSYPDLEREFKYVRDTRFIEGVQPFSRRLTWMYPDDGCYARAELAAVGLSQHNFPEPKKIFVFGNLKAVTKNAPRGAVEWWYHVAVTYRVGHEAYVFDPAIEPQRPLKLAEWNKAVGGERSFVQYTICSAKTFDPNSDCQSPRGLPLEEALEEQRGFLSPEWDRLLELNRDPEKELGNEPPWL